MKKSSLIETMNWNLDRAKKEIEEFAGKLAGDPLDAMKWADGAIKASAEVTVLHRYLIALEESTLEEVRSYLLNDVLRGAKYPENSTSKIHNIAGEKELSAKAELLEQFNNVKED